MELLEHLLNRRWILKSADKDLYYQARDGIAEIRKFATDKMGCQIIENSLLVKMEKIPAKPEIHMGINEFTSRTEYVFLCLILMYLEDKEPEEQFILSQLTEYISSNMPGRSVDWTVYTERRRLVKVLRFGVSQGMIRITDGSDDVFMDKEEGEVLYENTGASRYFMKNFARDIMNYQTPEDFMASDWFAMDEDRGKVRRHRVYKKLMFSMGMYREGNQDEDFEYLKYYGRRLADDLEQTFDCQLHIHKSSAFLILGDDCRMGTVFPGNNVVADIILLFCNEVQQNVHSGSMIREQGEAVILDEISFERLLSSIQQKYGSGFTKKYRVMTKGDFIKDITGELEIWGMIVRNQPERTVSILAAAGKMSAGFPKQFVSELNTTGEAEDE